VGDRGEVVATIAIDPATARVHEQGWQSWTPSATYAVDAAPYRAREARWHRPPGVRDRGPVPAFEGAGVLAVLPASGEPVHLWALDHPARDPPLVRAVRSGSTLRITADRPVRAWRDAGPGGIAGSLARWADLVAGIAELRSVRPAPTAWCTWYQYFTDVTGADVLENLTAIERLGLPVDVVQIDDGWQAGVGDWLGWSEPFRALDSIIEAIRAGGRRAGIWIAPFLAGSRSAVADHHPEWLIRDATGRAAVLGRNWDQDLFGLDSTHPGVRAYLAEVLGALRDLGIDYVKADFVWAAAVDGPRHDGSSPHEAYRSGMELLRSAIGDAYLVGCGAPILPSIGLVDAMRISPDTAPHWQPDDGDLSSPGARSAVITGEARAWQHGRWWVNDPDCLIVRPSVERREDWARHVEMYGGLRASSDRLAELDPWGLEVTRRLLATPPPPTLVDASEAAVDA
jgi:alpha-galactosidase